MNGSESVTATFTQNLYTLTTSANPVGTGSVSPMGGSYPSGTSVIVTATAATGWRFISWSGSNDLTSTTTNPTTITMNGNETVTATFTQITTTSQIINYNMPGDLGSVFSVWWTNNLDAGNDIKGTVSLSGSTPFMDWSNTWTFEIDDPLGNVAFSQAYTFSSGSIKTFDFITNQAGTWKIKVSDASNYSRTLQITILPAGWH